ncbi:hypothetical protein Lal_00026560, partial [Lupinus albus]
TLNVVIGANKVDHPVPERIPTLGLCGGNTNTWMKGLEAIEKLKQLHDPTSYQEGDTPFDDEEVEACEQGHTPIDKWMHTLSLFEEEEEWVVTTQGHIPN